MSLITKEVLTNLLNKVFDNRLSYLEKKSTDFTETYENCYQIIKNINKIDLNHEFNAAYVNIEEKRFPFSTRDNKNKIKNIMPLRTLTNSATKDRIKYLDNSNRKEKSSKKLPSESKQKENELICTATKHRPKTQFKELNIHFDNTEIKDDYVETFPNEMKTCMTLKSLKGNKSNNIYNKV